jgi:hypothetical protein
LGLCAVQDLIDGIQMGLLSGCQRGKQVFEAVAVGFPGILGVFFNTQLFLGFEFVQIGGFFGI